MQDIDFDEIDRAVGSVGGSSVAPSTPPALDVPTLAGSPAARRSTGRFMDVVHSSSDMRSSRPDAPLTPTPRVEEVSRDASVPSREEPAAAEATAAFHWPDPIDAAPVSHEEPTAAPSLESPFLPGAQIEKRPLGAFSDPEPSPEGEVPEVREEPAMPQPELIDTEAMIEPEVVPQTAEPTAEPPVVNTPVEDVPVGPTSITQQYTEQPTSAPESSGSIFDTEAYHQPVLKPVKKHSGLLVAVWIVGLIVVGGGVGATVYYIVLPMIT